MNSTSCPGTRRLHRGLALAAIAALLFARAVSGREVATATASPAPTLTVIAGDNQTGTPGQFNPKPFDIAVWNAAGTEPLVDTDVTFTVQFGGGQLAGNNTTLALPNASVTLRTDEDGTVQAYYKQPAIPGILSQIKASVGAAEIVLETQSLASASDANSASGNGRSSTAEASDVASSVGNVRSNSSAGAKSVAAMAAPTRSGQGADSLTARALTLAAATVKIRTPASQYYAVNTSTWTITTTSP